jgi:DNA-binding transcriptional MerR regulator
MALTVAQLAEVIARPGANRAAVVERLRAWSDAGILEPADRNPGTGRRREYADDVAYDAGLLNMLADLGLPIGRQRYFMSVLLLAQQAKDLWAEKRSGGLCLEIADFGEPNHQGGQHAVFLHDGAKRGHLGNLIHPRAEGSLIVNVSRLFARIDKNMKELAKSTQAIAKAGNG